jgi:hypothetical protein
LTQLIGTPQRSFVIIDVARHAGGMNTLPIIAFIDARAATTGRLRGARTDDAQERPTRRRTTRPPRP